MFQDITPPKGTFGVFPTQLSSTHSPQRSFWSRGKHRKREKRRCLMEYTSYSGDTVETSSGIISKRYDLLIFENALCEDV